MSIKVMTWVWENSRHKGANLLLLLAIADHAHDDGGGAYPSIRTLAKKVRMSERNVNHILIRVADELEVQRGIGPNGVNLYRVKMGGAKFSPVLSDRGERQPPEDEDYEVSGVNGASPKPSLESSIESEEDRARAQANIDAIKERQRRARELRLRQEGKR